MNWARLTPDPRNRRSRAAVKARNVSEHWNPTLSRGLNALMGSSEWVMVAMLIMCPVGVKMFFPPLRDRGPVPIRGIRWSRPGELGILRFRSGMVLVG
ncbi:hypothetical protein JCM30394_13250 [Deferrisoma palaeochoriense]